jgi:hypothetical protein
MKVVGERFKARKLDLSNLELGNYCMQVVSKILQKNS